MATNAVENELPESKRNSHQVSEEELGVAAIYSRLQQAMRMTSSVEAKMTMREKLTMMPLVALARVIGGIRERTTKPGKEGRAIIERVLATIASPTGRENLNKKPRIIECQSCHSLAKLLHGYSRVAYFSAAFWSDGKLWWTLMQEMDEITKCAQCGCYDRVSQAKEWRGRESFWKRPKYRKELTASEYLDALQKGVAKSKKDEMFLRVRAWWAANDPYRNRRPVADVVLPAPATENLVKLSGLLDGSDPDHVLMKAEIARELRRMDEADRILARSLPPKYDYAVTQFRRWIQAGERRVQWIKWDDAADLFRACQPPNLVLLKFGYFFCYQGLPKRLFADPAAVIIALQEDGVSALRGYLANFMDDFTRGKPISFYGIPENYSSLFSIQTRHFDSCLSAILITYPQPPEPPIEQAPGLPLLAPYFTAILFNPSSMAGPRCYALSQNPTGGTTTLRGISGENSHGNCMVGCNPTVEDFVSLIVLIEREGINAARKQYPTF